MATVAGVLSAETNCKVLVVDDDDAQRHAMVQMLEQAGFKVIEATSGRDALAAVLEQRPDVVLLDLILPDVNGLTFGNALREKPTTHKPAIIYYSSVTTPQEHCNWDRRQMGSFLTAPVEPDQLVSVVRGALARAETAENGNS